jgi:hypothetical protein
MDITIATEEPSEVDMNEIRLALEELGYWVASITVTDRLNFIVKEARYEA